MARLLDEHATADVPTDVGMLPEGASAGGGVIGRVVFWIGATGLLLATATDSLAVLGRHIGVAFLGSIEIVQCAVVLAASAAMIGATLQRAHASVHIFTERMPPAAAARLARLAALLGAALFLAAAIGSAWIARDLWDGYERTEILGIPLRWFRVIWIGSALAITALFARGAWARQQ